MRYNAFDNLTCFNTWLDICTAKDIREIPLACHGVTKLLQGSGYPRRVAEGTSYLMEGDTHNNGETTHKYPVCMRHFFQNFVAVKSWGVNENNGNAVSLKANHQNLCIWRNLYLSILNQQSQYNNLCIKMVKAEFSNPCFQEAGI